MRSADRVPRCGTRRCAGGITTRVFPLLAAAVLLALAGCALGPYSESRPAESAPSSVAIHLDTLTELTTASAARQRRLLADLELAHATAPTSATHVQLALALSTPGHEGFAPQRAHAMLDAALDGAAELTDDEARLLRLRRAELLHTMHNERSADAASHEADEDSARQQHEVEAELREARQRAGRLQDENQRLAEALREAEIKLEAITTIERSIRERDEGNGPPPPTE